ncbi:hypothetical protein [Nocardioides nanhaiensis]|uniref:Phage tail tape measure protein n=1 Tax=Nocardioides nanhaiensis TaxID=1476871 RepID=A0ABP8X3N2_9ACTN
MAGPIRIAILANASQAKRELSSVSKQTQTMGSLLGKVGRTAGVALGTGLAVAGAATVAWAKDSVEALARIERIGAQTASVIKSTGGAANVTAKDVTGLADRLERLTATEAESTQEGANLLLTFTNIRNGVGKSNQIFDRTTTSMVDLARAMGTEPKAAAIQLGKALNDPVKGVSALTRVGVSFTESQKQTIKSLTESGNVMGAQKVILKELERQFGGSGAAFAKTAAGQAEAAKNAFGNLGETIFSVLLPPLAKLATAASQALDSFSANYGDQISAGIKAAGSALATLGDQIGNVFDYVRSNADTFKIIGAAVAGAGAALLIASGAVKAFTVAQIALNVAMTANPIGIIVVAIGALVGALVVLYQRNEAVRNAINNLFAFLKQNAGPVLASLAQTFRAAFEAVRNIVQRAVVVIRALWRTFGSTILSFARSTFQNVASVIRGAMQVIRGVIKVITGAIRGDWSMVWNGIKSIISGVWNIIKGIVRQGVNVVRTGISAGWTAVKNLTSRAWDGIRKAVGDAINGVIQLASGLKGRVTGVLSGIGSWLFSAGLDLIRGLINGIEAMAGQAVDAAKGVVKGAINGAKALLGIKSPSRVFKNIGRDTMRGLILGFAGGKKGAVSAMNDVLSSVVDLMEKADFGKDRIKRETKQLRKLLDGRVKEFKNHAVKVARVATQLAAAQKLLADRLKQRDDYAGNVANSMLGFGAVTNLTTVFSTSDMLDQLRARIARVKEFAALLKRLAAMKLDKTIYDQLVQAGPEAGFATAQVIASGGQAAVAEFNTLQNELKNAANALGTQTSTNMYQAGVDAARGLVAGLESQSRRLEQASRRMAQALVNAIKKALGIKSPSRVAMSLGRYFTEGLQVGTGQIDMRKVGQGLSRDLVNGFGTPTPRIRAEDVYTSRRDSERGQRNYTIQVNVSPTADKVAIGREIKKALNDFERAGGR